MFILATIHLYTITIHLDIARCEFQQQFSVISVMSANPGPSMEEDFELEQFFFIFCCIKRKYCAPTNGPRVLERTFLEIHFAIPIPITFHFDRFAQKDFWCDVFLFVCCLLLLLLLLSIEMEKHWAGWWPECHSVSNGIIHTEVEINLPVKLGAITNY